MVQTGGQAGFALQEGRIASLRSTAVAYCAQTPFIRSDTLRANILFGAPYDHQRYEAVVDGCALRPDFGQLAHGDQTLVGERGCQLSGGQMARTALARALYSRTSVLLLDDVLSAVDADTSVRLIETLSTGPLVEGRTIILVTHAVAACLGQASYVVALEDGRVRFAGSPDMAASTLDISSSPPSSSPGRVEAAASADKAVEREEQAAEHEQIGPSSSMRDH